MKRTYNRTYSYFPGAPAVGGLRQAPDGCGGPAAEAQSAGGGHQGDRRARQERERPGGPLSWTRRARRLKVICSFWFYDFKELRKKKIEIGKGLYLYCM